MVTVKKSQEIWQAEDERLTLPVYKCPDVAYTREAYLENS